jgi:hypothetical protein
MGVASDIPRAWIHPARVMTERFKQGPDDKVAFVYVAVGSVLGFVAQLPTIVRRAREPAPALEAELISNAGEGRILSVPENMIDAKFEFFMSGALMAWIFVVPLILYIVALLSHWIARVIGGKGTALRARVALFWSFLVVTPGLLLSGLTTGFIGDGIQAQLVGMITVCAFFWVWLNSLYVAETKA